MLFVEADMCVKSILAVKNVFGNVLCQYDTLQTDSFNESKKFVDSKEFCLFIRARCECRRSMTHGLLRHCDFTMKKLCISEKKIIQIELKRSQKLFLS